MMYRSAWAAKPNQEIILALKLTRTYFGHLLESAVPSSWDGVSYGSREEWRKALRASDVVVQWDPDHHLVTGAKLPYRVIQLGIRGQTLDAFRGSGFVSIADITTEAKAMRQQIATDGLSNDVRTPREKEYPIPDSLALVLGLEREAK